MTHFESESQDNDQWDLSRDEYDEPYDEYDSCKVPLWAGDWHDE